MNLDRLPSALDATCVAALVLALVVASQAAAEPSTHGDATAPIEHDFVGAAKCKSCHKKELMGNQHATWLAGPHRRAFAVLSEERSLAIATERGLAAPPSEAGECLMCHVTAYGVPPERIMNPLDPSDGVQCESCHGPGRDFRKKKIMSDPEKAAEAGLWDLEASPSLCLRCHNAASPTYDPGRYTLPDGSTSDFDYAQAAKAIAHPIPPDVKGRFIELEKQQREEEKRAKAAGR